MYEIAKVVLCLNVVGWFSPIPRFGIMTSFVVRQRMSLMHIYGLLLYGIDPTLLIHRMINDAHR